MIVDLMNMTLKMNGIEKPIRIMGYVPDGYRECNLLNGADSGYSFYINEQGSVIAIFTSTDLETSQKSTDGMA